MPERKLVRVGEGCVGCYFRKDSNNGVICKCKNPNPVTFFDTTIRHWFCKSHTRDYVPVLRPEFSLNFTPP